MGELAIQKSLDYMTNQFQAIVKEFDSLKAYVQKTPEEISSLKKGIDHLSKYVEGNEKVIQDIKKDLLGIKELIQGNTESQRRSNLELSEKFNQVEVLKNSFRNLNDVLSKRVTDIEEAVKVLSKDLISRVDNMIEKSIEVLSKDVVQLKVDLKNSIDLVMQCNEKTFSFAIQAKESLLSRLEKYSSDNYSLEKSVNESNQNFIDKITLLETAVSEKIDKAIASQPKPNIPSLDDAKLAMKKELELFALDAKNANLRSVNSENEIMVLKKKFESILLMIKKLEISEEK